jgi:long-chain fatty acid transport protein
LSQVIGWFQAKHSGRNLTKHMKNVTDSWKTLISCRAMGKTLPTLTLALLWCASASGVGLRDPNQDPEGIARGNAFVATADNPSAIYYNPAGITQLEGNNARVGLYLISANTDYRANGVQAHTDSSFQPVPSLYYVYAPTNLPLAFGLGVYTPFGLSLDWGKKTPFTSLAENGQILYVTINPVIAWRVNDKLSLAIGPDINYSTAQLDRGIFGVPGGQFHFSGNGTGFGFNAGVRWQPIDQVAFGVSYHSASQMTYEGNSGTRPTPPLPGPSSTQATAQFPQFVAGGISYRPTKNWNLEADIDWTDWDTLNTVVFRGTSVGNVPFVFNYKSSFMYEFGVTRQLGKGYFVSTGYIYSENSSPNKNFNPIVPDSVLHLGSVGFGHHGHRWDWTAAYHFAYGDRDVTGNVQFGTAETANGHYHTFNNAFDLAATLKF